MSVWNYDVANGIYIPISHSDIAVVGVLNY